MKPICALLIALCLLAPCVSYANNAAYQQRQQDYITMGLGNVNTNSLSIQAYSHVPLDSGTLHGLLNDVSTTLTSDFDIVILVRVLNLTNGTYDSAILPVVNSVPYWLTKNETHRTYWSENHMCMWMSCDWLLHEKYGKAVDPNLDKRLRHFLKMKVQYGFYEFYSSVYAPYCLSGLLNLADFAQDAEIKNLATQAAQLLLKDMLTLTNDKGTFFPVAGRNYYGKYETAYGQNHNSLIYLTSGLGQVPTSASHAGAFLATSSLPIDMVAASWVPVLDTVVHQGHTLDTGFILNDSMAEMDKTIFQWSSGAYFHPEVALETATLLTDSSLWNHPDFGPFTIVKNIPLPSVTATAEALSCLSKSSVIVNENIAIYKHHSVTLASVLDFWKGKLGYQQFPCVANVGTTAVFTASGEANNDWGARPAGNANQHLPYVAQKKNVSLIMYRPEPNLANIGFDKWDVSLHFKDADFDEVRNDNMWLLGRQGGAYVGIRRSCIGDIDSVRACHTTNGQTWVLMVGDSDTYGNFNNFQTAIDHSQFEERWYFDSVASQSVYYAKIVVDSTTIDYAWNRDSVNTGITNITESSEGLNIYPNPANDNVIVDLSSFINQSITVSVTNTLGQCIMTKSVAQVTSNTEKINSSQWPKGIYIVIVQSENGMFTKRLVKE